MADRLGMALNLEVFMGCAPKVIDFFTSFIASHPKHRAGSALPINSLVTGQGSYILPEKFRLATVSSDGGRG